MRYLMTLLAIIAISFASPFCYAKASAPVVRTKTTKADIAKQVALYSKPSTSAKILAKLSPWQTLVPIYQKGVWMKVGNPADGMVGWVNMQDYYKLMADFNKPRIKTIVVTSTSTKPDKYKIIAYENGKKLSKKRAQELYKKIQKQQMYTDKQFQKMQKQMDKLFQRTMSGFDRIRYFSPMWMSPVFPVGQPVIVIMQPPSS